MFLYRSNFQKGIRILKLVFILLNFFACKYIGKQKCSIFLFHSSVSPQIFVVFIWWPWFWQWGNLYRKLLFVLCFLNLLCIWATLMHLVGLNFPRNTSLTKQISFYDWSIASVKYLFVFLQLWHQGKKNLMFSCVLF